MVRLGTLLGLVALGIWGACSALDLGLGEGAPAELDRDGIEPNREAAELAEVGSEPTREVVTTIPLQEDSAAGESATDSSLRLHFTNARGEHLKGDVELWRIDAPATEQWTRGDALVGSAEHGKNGSLFEGLHEGLYRAWHLGSGVAAADPPPFEVKGEWTELSFAGEPPARFEVRVRVFDAEGRELTHAQGRVSNGHSWAHPRPAWVALRASRDASLDFGAPVRGGGGRSGGGLHTRRLEAEEHGFLLGSYSENTKGRRYLHRASLRLDGRTNVECEFSGDAPEDRYFRAVTVPIQPFREAIRLPDGRPAHEHDRTALISVTCQAVPADDPTPLDELVFHVRCALEGFEDLEFEYRLAEGPIPVHTLVLASGD